jgi:hypothetical protein
MLRRHEWEGKIQISKFKTQGNFHLRQGSGGQAKIQPANLRLGWEWPMNCEQARAQQRLQREVIGPFQRSSAGGPSCARDGHAPDAAAPSDRCLASGWPGMVRGSFAAVLTQQVSQVIVAHTSNE